MRLTLLVAALSAIPMIALGAPLTEQTLPIEKKISTIVRIERGCLTFDGLITEQAVSHVEALKTHLPTCLLIRSAGGGAAQGMKLGRIVHTRGMNVTILDYCMSGCANYVFPAGKRKEIPPNSILTVHTSATTAAEFLSLLKGAGRWPKDAPLSILSDISKERDIEKAYAGEIGLPYEYYSRMPSEYSMQAKISGRPSLDFDGTHSMFSIRGRLLRSCFGMQKVVDRRSENQFAANGARYADALGVRVFSDAEDFGWCAKRKTK